jgi:hypothetical protein
MRFLRYAVSGLVMAAMLCVGFDGSSLSMGTAAYAKKRHKKKRHRKHARRRHRKHARNGGGATPEL